MSGLEEVGVPGPDHLREALTNCTDPLAAIEEFQASDCRTYSVYGLLCSGSRIGREALKTSGDAGAAPAKHELSHCASAAQLRECGNATHLQH